ncbi:MAG TPA: hypothetical protein VFB31_03660 [Pseudolabrys sp.]|nr:hypothetical protein [Pseudolabrys sp.]
MIKTKNVVAELRRDATYVGRAVAMMLVIGFAAIVVAAALYDLVSLHH